MANSLVIVGVGGHAVSVWNVAVAAGMDVIAFLDEQKAGQVLLDIPVMSKDQALADFADAGFHIAIGDNARRSYVAEEYLKIMSADAFPPLIHPSAVISHGASVGNGSVVMPNVTVGPQSEVGKFCLLNTNASIDHDCRMSDYSSIAPGAHTGGDVSLGLRSAVSIGASVKHGIAIGADTVIGANSYVSTNVPDNVVCYGVPAKVIRQRNEGDAYLS